MNLSFPLLFHTCNSSGLCTVYICHNHFSVFAFIYKSNHCFLCLKIFLHFILPPTPSTPVILILSSLPSPFPPPPSRGHQWSGVVSVLPNQPPMSSPTLWPGLRRLRSSESSTSSIRSVSRRSPSMWAPSVRLSPFSHQLFLCLCPPLLPLLSFPSPSLSLNLISSLSPSPLSLPQNGRYMSELSGKLYAARDKSVYLLSAMPLKEQVILLD